MTMETCRACGAFLMPGWDTCKICGHDPAVALPAEVEAASSKKGRRGRAEKAPKPEKASKAKKAAPAPAAAQPEPPFQPLFQPPQPAHVPVPEREPEFALTPAR